MLRLVNAYTQMAGGLGMEKRWSFGLLVMKRGLNYGLGSKVRRFNGIDCPQPRPSFWFLSQGRGPGNEVGLSSTRI